MLIRCLHCLLTHQHPQTLVIHRKPWSSLTHIYNSSVPVLPSSPWKEVKLTCLASSQYSKLSFPTCLYYQRATSLGHFRNMWACRPASLKCRLLKGCHVLRHQTTLTHCPQGTLEMSNPYRLSPQSLSSSFYNGRAGSICTEPVVRSWGQSLTFKEGE